jgi:hypothetical protein
MSASGSGNPRSQTEPCSVPHATPDREVRPGSGVGNRRPATLGVPAQDLVGETQTPHGIRPRGELHAARRHPKDIRSAGRVEHVHPFEETSERLAVLAVADEAEAGGRGDIARDTAHVAAPAPKREVHYDIVAFDIVRHENHNCFD